jgi:hypothetical protein
MAVSIEQLERVEQLKIWEESGEITCSRLSPKNYRRKDINLVMVMEEGMYAHCEHCKQRHLIAHQEYLNFWNECVKLSQAVRVLCEKFGKLFVRFTRKGVDVWCKSCDKSHLIEHLEYMKLWKRKKCVHEGVDALQLPLFADGIRG